MPTERPSTSSQTLANYSENAESFWRGTAHHDVSQNYGALLQALAESSHVAPYTILDFGCGPGRDLLYFRSLGHEAVGLDGCEAFVKMAKEFSGCEVLAQDFLQLDLPSERFHGIFANASLFHVPSQELPRVLGELAQALRPNGILFSSNPRGDGDAQNWQEGWSGGRYGAYYPIAAWRRFMTGAGFEEVEHYYRPPGKPRAEQPWLASVWRKR